MRPRVIGLAGVMALATVSFFPGQVLAQASGSSAASPAFVTQQPANEWRAELFIGEAVLNTAGEPIGDISDLIFDRAGRISTAVIGVGGFLGVGEKEIGVPFATLTFDVGKNGERVIVAALSKEDLAAAPKFKATEETTFDRVKNKAVDLGNKARDEAVDLKDRALKKVDDMRTGETKQ